MSRHYMLLLIGGHRSDSKRFAFVKLDPADYAWAAQYRWIIHTGHQTLYAKRAVYTPGDSNTRVRMHRELVGLTSGDPREVDHRNGDGLDNRRENLRIASRAENAQNRPSSYRRRAGKSSGHRGVSRTKGGRWEAYAHLGGCKIGLGHFADEQDAAAAAAAFRREHFSFSDEPSKAAA